MLKFRKKSYFECICNFNPFHKTIYGQAQKYIFEYLDMKNIIRRLQEIDKLKLIIFDKNQLKIFEKIPKPGIEKIGQNENFEESTILTMQNIQELRKYSNLTSMKKSISSLNMLDPMNKRIIDLISNFKQQSVY